MKASLVTMAAGLTMARIREMAGGAYPIIRLMPNTPASIGEGMILHCSDGVEQTEIDEFLGFMAAAGRFDALPEQLIDAGSAVKLVLESARHPGDLKDAVCSPGGSTIQGVRRLEEGAFRADVMDAVIAAYDKTRELGQK